MKPSGYLAVRCLRQLALDDGDKYPLGAQVVLSDFYVDDEMSGAMSTEDAIEMYHQVTALLAGGGLELRKWASNSEQVLERIPTSLRETQIPLELDANNAVKSLGMKWNPFHDYFLFETSINSSNVYTKRAVLSEIAKVYDPLGLLAPIIVRAKIFMQGLWQLNLGWDEPLPQVQTERWKLFKNDLPEIEKIRIPRCTTVKGFQEFHLHGFCDASESAYAACIYLVSVLTNGNFESRLIAAKTRVAPLKTLSLPRLELCSAVLLVRLMTVVKECLKHLQILDVKAWTDSTVSRDWIKGNPNRWKTFVANRVSEIRDVIPSNNWYHLPGLENPADPASRGVSPEDLRENMLWWNGPPWLSHPTVMPEDNEDIISAEALKEEKRIVSVNLTINTFGVYCEQFANISQLRHRTATWLRFISNLKGEKNFGQFTVQELDRAESSWVRFVQREHFVKEYCEIASGKPINRKSAMFHLCPFSGDDGLLRVGGRLRKSNLPLAQRKPVLLPANSHLTTLLIRFFHRRTLHGGVQLTLAAMRTKYWVLNGKKVVRKVIRSCLVCVRQAATTGKQLMGDLPSERVTISAPFTMTGVDYAGPFNLKFGRGQKSYKGYVALFVCMCTRAIHLELVGDLSSESFLGAFRRFAARRGTPRKMFSDRGTNFVGAERELKALVELSMSRQLRKTWQDEGVQWEFNPPSAPHFGGLWEAGVKSTKYHLKRVLGEAFLSFEEMSTVLVQIEACLNSRPIGEMSSDPNDFEVLTPGHFLAWKPLVALPDQDLEDAPINRLNRWQKLQQMVQQFWRRWVDEYLTRLQARPKWCTEEPNMKTGNLVIIKDERLPPSKWKLGRIVECHPGGDGKVRVVTVKTAEGTYSRPIVKICLLPIETAI
ncbi:unnamed protein product [Allacma fusca]|uniref:Integrase catalytic domain-containing protein n=1 Tax=Allacma fusca TaxID=39272 RepID=A0A8J2NZC9_9HEXA|nr:unnamed protein product [Allacma fusca]